MKTKLFTFFLALVAGVGTMFATSGTCGENLTWELTDDGVLTISGTGTMTNWGESSYVPWYSYRGNIITSIIIGNSVTSIGRYAFYGCSGLTSITIPNSVTSIGNYAFDGCKSLTSITIPNSVTSIGDEAFLDCSGLTSVTIGNSVTSIGENAFKDCTGLTSVTIGNSVTSIGENAFKGCTGLPVVDNIRYADTYLVEAVDKKSSIYTIKEGTKWIGEDAFRDCYGLTSITIPNSVTRIGDNAFSSCTGLTSITIPNSVTSIGDLAFYECTGLTSITIPNSVTIIGAHAFWECEGLTSITIYSETSTWECEEEDFSFSIVVSDVHIFSFAFFGCENLSYIYNYSNAPQHIHNATFDDEVKVTCKLYVPEEALELFKSAEGWKEFGENILPISAAETEVTSSIQIEPTTNTAEIAWKKVDGAYTYELAIKDKNGNMICTLVFNAQGQLTSIAFNAPSRNQAPQKTQAAGFAFTVTGLDSGTAYDYTLTAKDGAGATLKTETGSFTTTGLQALEQVPSNQAPSTKVIRDGKLFIERGDKTYTVTGQEAK